jgi:hypothetical protein
VESVFGNDHQQAAIRAGQVAPRLFARARDVNPELALMAVVILPPPRLKHGKRRRLVAPPPFIYLGHQRERDDANHNHPPHILGGYNYQ